MSHAKAKLTPASRLLLVERVLVEGWPPAHAAEMAGVLRATVYKWLRRFRTEGVAALADRSSWPRSCPQRTAAAIEAALVQARQRLRRGPHLLAGRLGMAPSTVHAVLALARHGLFRLARLDRVTGRPIRYERARPGELVHVDVKRLGRIPDGGGWKVHGRAERPARKRGSGYDYLHVAVDDHSRCAYVEVHPDEQGATCVGFLTRAIAHLDGLGVTVERIMTDNAKNYVLSKAFQAALGQVSHKLTRPYRPRTNGKVERFNRTLLDEWAYQRSYDTNDEPCSCSSSTTTITGRTQRSATDHRSAGSRQQRDWEPQLGRPPPRSDYRWTIMSSLPPRSGLPQAPND